MEKNKLKLVGGLRQVTVTQLNQLHWIAPLPLFGLVLPSSITDRPLTNDRF